MTVRVDVSPDLLAWAIERSGQDPQTLHARFPKLSDWEAGERQPTLKQLEQFATATYTPIGLFFLPEAPSEELPLPDFRTMWDAKVRRPSADLLDTIYLCEQRQDWFRDYARAGGAQEVTLVGSLAVGTPAEEAAAQIREALGFSMPSRRRFTTWAEALRGLIEMAEEVGILVMVSGVVGSNTHRKLDPEEFRGFALTDSWAPLVFVNGADTKAAQIFTLAHELVHIWVGESGVSNARLDRAGDDELEKWCNAVAGELLVPQADLRAEFDPKADLREEATRLARRFKVSGLVVLRRLSDSRLVQWDAYRAAYEAELELALEKAQDGGGGGDFYNTQPARVSRRFAKAIVASALEGTTLRREALRLLGFKSSATFDELSERLGVS